MSVVAGVIVGWISLATGLALFLGAVIRVADFMEDTTPPKQPAGVRDPETGLLYDEHGRLVGRSWVA